MNLIKEDAVSARLSQRHILDEDLVLVIKAAEESGEKLYTPGNEKYLTKKWLSEAMFYVEYSVSDEGYTIHSAYMHRSQFTEDK